MTRIDPDGILRHARGMVDFFGPAHVHGRVSSTQDEAAILARDGAIEGTVVVAESQSGGRGRHGREWFSPPSGGLYVSVVLRPAADATHWPAISVIAGLGLAQGLASSGIEDVRLKWPNDCLVGKRKLAGILAEAFPDMGFVLLGIGLNLSLVETDPPPEILTKATDLATHLPAGADPEVVCARGLAGVVRAYRMSPHGLEVDPGMVDEFLWTREKVNVDGVEGRVSGIDPTGALVLECEGGTRTLVRTGEVTDAGCD